MTIKNDLMSGRMGLTTQTSAGRLVNGVVVTTNNPQQWASYTAFQRSRSGSAVKDWKRKIASGLDATGAYNVSVTRDIRPLQYCDGRWTLKDGGKTYLLWDTWQGNLVSTPVFSSLATASLQSHAENLAKSSFWANASEAKAQGLTILGELRETAHMLRHPMDATYNLIMKYLVRVGKKPPRFKSAKAVSKWLSGQYLELVFGWDPLIQDVEDIYQALERVEREPKFLRIKGYGKASDSAASAVSSGSLPNNWFFTYYDRSSVKYESRAIGALRVQAGASSPVGEYRRALGFSISEFVPTLWELLPWSFVVDYFTNIGDVIASGFHASADLAWSCLGTRREETTMRYGSLDRGRTAAAHPTLRSITMDLPPTGVEKFTFTRTQGVPFPSLVLRLPGTKQEVNLAALFAQAASSSRSLS